MASKPVTEFLRAGDVVKLPYTGMHGACKTVHFLYRIDKVDHDVYAWIVEAAPAPAEHDTALLSALRAFRLTLSEAARP